MPAFLSTQNLSPASNIQTLAAPSGVKNSTNTIALDEESGSFSALYKESVGDTDPSENVTGAISSGENQAAVERPVNVNGKPADQAANELGRNGNYLPGNEYNPISSLEASGLKTSNSRTESSETVVGQNPASLQALSNSSMPNDKGIRPENVVVRSKEGSDSGSKMPVANLDQTSIAKLALNDLNSSGVNATTVAGLQEKDGMGKQVSGVLSQNSGSLAAVLGPVESDSQILLNPIKNTNSLENVNPIITHPLANKVLTQSSPKGLSEGRVASINARTNLLQVAESEPGLSVGKLKSMALESAKEVNQLAWNQTIRPLTLQNLESPTAINRDIASIVSSQYSAIASGSAVSAGEDSENQSLRTLAAIPTLGLSQPNQMISAAPPTSILTTNVNSPAWSAEFSQQMVIFSQKGIQQANLQLNPQHLGPMEVRISIGSEQQINLSFNTQHGMAKEAIDIALPRLREMFEQQGLNLGNVNVSKHSEQSDCQQKFNNNAPSPTSENNSSVEETPEDKTLMVTNVKSNYLVDYYA